MSILWIMVIQTIDMPVKNREGDYVTKGFDGSIYMLRRIPPGRECDVRRAAELFEAAGNLAKIHLLMRKKIMEKCRKRRIWRRGI